MVEALTKSPLELQLTGLATLLQLEKQARQSRNLAEFGFSVANDTLKLIGYRQAVLWRKKGRSVKILNVSGVERPNRNSPYLLWLRKVLQYLLKSKESRKIQSITKDSLPKKMQAGWQEWIAPHVVLIPLISHDGHFLGGLWLMRDDPWHQGETSLLAQLAESYAHSWQALMTKPRFWRPYKINFLRPLLKCAILAGIVAALFLPVKLSVLAPAQIVPVNPLVISAPMRGVIKQISVLPNQAVEKGQLLFRLDDTELRSQYEVASKALAVAEAEYQQARQKSLFNRDKSVDLDVLKARVAMKKAEMDYAAEELARIDILAEQSGIVIFADSNDWLGKPVVTGEKVMLLADSSQKEIELEVPLDNAINLEPGAQVRLFLNVDPSLDIKAVIRQSSYEALETPSGNLAYLAKASLNNSWPGVRIGLAGTAKIYGRQTPLYYYLFRRPWATLRRKVGF